MWTKIGPVWLLKPGPPPPPGPQIAKNVFTYEKLIIHCYSLLYICLMTLKYLMIQHTIPQDAPKMETNL